MKPVVFRAFAALVAFVWSVGFCAAQESTLSQADQAIQDQVPVRAPVVTLDRERLFEGSMMGQAMSRRLDAASNDLIAENRRLEQALEQEERDLTERRKTMPPEEFRAIAAEFDDRVEQLRSAQDAKSRALTRQNEEDRQRFFAVAVPVLGQLMADVQAVAIIDRSAVILIFDRLDITDLAIERLNAELGEGPSELSQNPQPEGTDPLPEATPAVPTPTPNP